MRSLWAVLVLFVYPAVAGAQAPTVPAPPRGDVSGAVGWLHVPFEPSSHDSLRDDDWTRHATGTATAGLYWNDHWKTELSAEVSTRPEVWDTEVLRVGNEIAYRSVRHRIQYTQFTLAQFYQFGRNDWVHPALGAGVLIQRRGGESEYSPAVISGSPRGPIVTIDPGGRKDLATTTIAAPFVAAALKAYITPRAFFRTDLQVAFRRDVESVVMHAGFGIDF